MRCCFQILTDDIAVTFAMNLNAVAASLTTLLALFWCVASAWYSFLCVASAAKIFFSSDDSLKLARNKPQEEKKIHNVR